MHFRHQQFIDSIHSKTKLSVTFYGKEDGKERTRVCAPMDFGPSRRAKDQSDRYHLWDYDSTARTHTLNLLPEQIARIEVLDEKFDPAEFVTWDTRKSTWFVDRNWGIYS
ncbi:MAG: hypothetical protein H0T92_15565 [Pyrinomonadaceae bacterium]|nr:hypothetical protein [Pyrinomonadaceae bacterium]